MPEDGLLQRAEGYLRTAQSAAENGDVMPAYENARTAAELAAKSMLQRKGLPFGKEHNVASDLVQAGLWPSGQPGKRLSKFLQDYTRGIYGFDEPVRAADLGRALRLAGDLLAAARKM
jgi:hypothetical protein